MSDIKTIILEDDATPSEFLCQLQEDEAFLHEFAKQKD